MFNGDADRSVQLMRDRGDLPDRLADRNLGNGNRVFGLRRAESVVRRRGDGQCRGGPCTFDLAGHTGQGVLDCLKLAERATELHALTGVLDGHGGCRVERTDDLHAAAPRAA